MNVAPPLPLEPENEGSVRVRTLFLSDIHLGTRGCQAERLLEFLCDYDADTIFLVGDIVDGWALKWTWFARGSRSFARMSPILSKSSTASTALVPLVWFSTSRSAVV
jgi:Icc-related predicted phosphoesterase